MMNILLMRIGYYLDIESSHIEDFTSEIEKFLPKNTGY